jgi:hypothetical protein
MLKCTGAGIENAGEPQQLRLKAIFKAKIKGLSLTKWRKPAET